MVGGGGEREREREREKRRVEEAMYYGRTFVMISGRSWQTDLLLGRNPPRAKALRCSLLPH